MKYDIKRNKMIMELPEPSNPAIKKIVVFGATGGTGKFVVEQAIKKGYHVTVIIRNPDAFTFSDRNLEIIKGDVLQPNTFEDAVIGKEAVISCLGSTRKNPTKVYSRGISNITTAMGKAGTKRIVCISAGAVVIPPNGSFIVKFVVKNILQRLFKYVYDDMLLMEEVLSKSDLDWTIIRAPRLINSEYTGKYRSSVNKHLINQSSISRADLADYIVTHLHAEKTFKARVEVSY